MTRPNPCDPRLRLPVGWRRREHEESLWMVNRDGTGRHLVVPGAFWGTMSPDGTVIAAVVTVRSPGGRLRHRIETMGPAGENRRQIYPSP